MLKGISPLISPELLKVLAEMGHGDELILADAHFPGNTFNDKVIRADGLNVSKLLEGIMPLFELDSYDDPIIMMAPVEGDELDTSVEKNYMEAIRKSTPSAPDVKRIGRFEFYERAQNAFAVVMTGELAKYGNILIKKGVIPVCPG
ncbi:MAG TPA: L-fucose mutarotase [Victivallales bacterium]|nr:L-fucose mutarotase [Victivallales bacterium]